MFKQSSRNQRSKGGFKVKHAIQLGVLLVVCLWLLHKVNKSDETGENVANVSEKVDDVHEISRIGRKGLLPQVEKTVPESENNVEEEENQDDEEEEEKSKPGEIENHMRGVGDDEFDEHNQEHSQGETDKVVEPVDENENEESEDIEEKKDGESWSDDEVVQEESVKGEENVGEEKKENEEKNGGEENEEKNEGEENEEKNESEEKEEKNGSEEKGETNESEEKENKNESEEKEEKKDSENSAEDKNTQDAREENYKGDDASSAVVRENQVVESETENGSAVNSNEEQVENKENDEQENKINIAEEVTSDQHDSGSKTEDEKTATNGEDDKTKTTLSLSNSTDMAESNVQPEVNGISTLENAASPSSVLQNVTDVGSDSTHDSGSKAEDEKTATNGEDDKTETTLSLSNSTDMAESNVQPEVNGVSPSSVVQNGTDVGSDSTQDQHQNVETGASDGGEVTQQTVVANQTENPNTSVVEQSLSTSLAPSAIETSDAAKGESADTNSNSETVVLDEAPSTISNMTIAGVVDSSVSSDTNENVAQSEKSETVAGKSDMADVNQSENSETLQQKENTENVEGGENKISEATM